MNRPTDSDVLCTRCGSEATWLYSDAGKTKVEVNCPDCGRYEMTKAEIETAEFDVVTLDVNQAEDRT